MSNCPKCGCTRISEPRFVKNNYGFESLEYTCMRCGFKAYEATLDQLKERENHDH